MKGKNLVAENIVSGSDVVRNTDGPLVVVRHQDISGKGVGRGDEAGTGDLEEAEIVLVDVLAGAVTGGEVVEDGTFVRLGPVGPLQGDDGAGGNSDVAFSGNGLAMADDVGVAIAVWLDETEIGLLGGPAGT
jgi:hypothetical protein